jgi:hypothetical protein
MGPSLNGREVGVVVGVAGCVLVCVGVGVAGSTAAEGMDVLVTGVVVGKKWVAVSPGGRYSA